MRVILSHMFSIGHKPGLSAGHMKTDTLSTKVLPTATLFLMNGLKRCRVEECNLLPLKFLQQEAKYYQVSVDSLQSIHDH